MLGPDCGGNFRYTEKGIKDCTNCLIPHLPENYGLITGKYKEIAAAMQQTVPSQKNGNDRQGRKTMDRIVMLACTERGFETMRGLSPERAPAGYGNPADGTLCLRARI